MKTPHKHAAFIKAWADGAEIQVSDGKEWFDTVTPVWAVYSEYRIKPEPKPDVVRYLNVYRGAGYPTPADAEGVTYEGIKSMVALTFDGKTDKLKSVEILK